MHPRAVHRLAGRARAARTDDLEARPSRMRPPDNDNRPPGPFTPRTAAFVLAAMALFALLFVWLSG